MNAADLTQSKSVTTRLLEAIARICELDPGSNRAEDRAEVCEAVDNARYLLLCLGKNPTAWSESEAPKDRPIVAIGKVMVEDEFSTTAIPFCRDIEWREVNGHSDWFYYDSDGYPMAVRRSLDDKVIIHQWVDYPRPDTKPEGES